VEDFMNKEIQIALILSIRRWEENLLHAERGEYFAAGVKDCPLCKKFNKQDDNGDVDCTGCPVQTKTGRPACFGTPYWAVSDKLKNETNNGRSLVELVQEELVFLRSLYADNREKFSLCSDNVCHE
jgi:hypothetical protein